MCGVHTQDVVVPPPTPKAAATAVFAPRLQSKTADAPQGTVGKPRTIADLHLTGNPFLSPTE